MTLFDMLLPYQKSLVLAKKKKKLALFGRQLGKSWAMGYLATQTVLTSYKPNPLALVISTGARASTEFLKKCVQFAEAVHILQPSITYSASADSIKFSTGARIVSLPSGNPPALRGWSASIVIIDEAAYIENPEEVWAAIAPTLTRDPDAELVVASTPAGKASWFYDLYSQALVDPNWYVQTTTIEDAVSQGLALDIDQLHNTIQDTDVWDREYMCKFAAEYSSMIDTSILEFVDVPEGLQHYWLGMDIGSTSDRTAIADLAELPDKSLLITDLTLLHKADYESQLTVLKEKHNILHYKAGFIDAVGIGGPVAEFASKQVSAKIKGFMWTSASKTPAYEYLRAKVFDHKLKFASHLKPLIVRDFQNVHRVISEAGKVSYEAGRNADGHSDATSAIVLALQAYKANPVTFATPQAQAMKSVFGMPFSYGSRLH